MSGGGKGGGGDYWPGFVDALTNVVIAMVFVIVVLAIALSFSAQLLAKRMAAKIAEQQAELGKARAALEGKIALVERQPSAGPPIDALTAVRHRIAVAGNEAALAASAASSRVKAAERFLQLDFAAGALTLDKAAADELAKAIAPLQTRLADAPPNARLAIVGAGPEMHLSESQRAAFIRVMAVRNQLLAQGVKAERISTRIETKTVSPNPIVSVRIEELP